eukprot:2425538-Prymnesium_polylepis.1
MQAKRHVALGWKAGNQPISTSNVLPCTSVGTWVNVKLSGCGSIRTNAAAGASAGGSAPLASADDPPPDADGWGTPP